MKLNRFQLHGVNPSLESGDGSREPVVAAGAHFPILDAIRGLAILLVLLFHSGLTSANATFQKLIWQGWVGVDLFFVLSGFLITGILLDTRLKKHSLRHFYARRFLRIFPLYYGFLVLFFLTPVGIFIVGSPELRVQAGLQQGWFWLHAQNWRIVYTRNWNFPHLNHFWSLAIEEQFYLFWPLVVILTGPRRLAFVAGSVLFLGVVARIALLDETSPMAIYAATFLRLDGFMTGALAALLVRGGATRKRLVQYGCIALFASAIPLWMIIQKHQMMLWEQAVTQTIGYTLIAIFFASAILLAVAAPRRSAVAWTVHWAPLRFLGKYSYAIYVFHFPVLFVVGSRVRLEDYPRFLQPFATSHPRLMIFALMAGISTALAVVSWHLFEKQFLRLKKHFEYERQSSPSAAPPVTQARAA
jgi:peptidoglycan/LPS O-acetylase OafA/YrhL